ncbi:MAG: hypothetical protein RLZZ271_91 [Pseudomonadota bacterium]|jgi:protease secretion system membrane fusion protein
MSELTVADAPVKPESQARPYLLLGWALIVFGFCGFLLWASLAPLDKGVPATGVVITDGNRKSVQHQTGGIIARIHVKDGDRVKQGQILMELDVTQTERSMGALRESMEGFRSLISGLEGSRTFKEMQLQNMNEQLKGMRQLAAEEYLPRNRVLELERQAAQIESALREDTGNIGRYKRQIAEAQERLGALQFERDNSRIKAPIEGVVQGLAINTVQGVVTQGMRIMDIVPSGQPLLIEAQVPPHLIDKIKPGLEVEVSFPAFNQNKTPTVEAIVQVVSADRFTDERTGNAYYKMTSGVTDKSMTKLRGLEIRPGMPADVFVKTGERSLMSYLFKPVLDRLGYALSQE